MIDTLVLENNKLLCEDTFVVVYVERKIIKHLRENPRLLLLISGVRVKH